MDNDTKNKLYYSVLGSDKYAFVDRRLTGKGKLR